MFRQHLSNIWSSIHEKLSNTAAKLKKSVAYKKSAYTEYKDCDQRSPQMFEKSFHRDRIEDATNYPLLDMAIMSKSSRNRPASLLKGDSDKGVFLLNFQNVKTPFLRKSYF